MLKKLFYEKGLQFSCTRCSICCRFEPGVVVLTKGDISRMSLELGLSEEDFLKKYCRLRSIFKKSYVLIERENLDCIFWKDGGCLVYKNRPLQCSSFPFWKSYLKNENEWEKLKDTCPGVGIGDFHNRAEIEAVVREREKENFV